MHIAIRLMQNEAVGWIIMQANNHKANDPFLKAGLWDRERSYHP